MQSASNEQTTSRSAPPSPTTIILTGDDDHGFDYVQLQPSTSYASNSTAQNGRHFAQHNGRTFYRYRMEDEEEEEEEEAGEEHDVCPDDTPESVRQETIGRRKKPGLIPEQDRLLPIANITRIMRRHIPDNGKISKEAKDIVQDCITELIGFLSSDANDRCVTEKRKVVTADDMLDALKNLGLTESYETMKLFLETYRNSTGRASARPPVYEPELEHAPNNGHCLVATSINPLAVELVDREGCPVADEAYSGVRYEYAANQHDAEEGEELGLEDIGNGFYKDQHGMHYVISEDNTLMRVYQLNDSADGTLAMEIGADNLDQFIEGGQFVILQENADASYQMPAASSGRPKQAADADPNTPRTRSRTKKIQEDSANAPKSRMPHSTTDEENDVQQQPPHRTKQSFIAAQNQRKLRSRTSTSAPAKPPDDSPPPAPASRRSLRPRSAKGKS